MFCLRTVILNSVWIDESSVTVLHLRYTGIPGLLLSLVGDVFVIFLGGIEVQLVNDIPPEYFYKRVFFFLSYVYGHSIF